MKGDYNMKDLNTAISQIESAIEYATIEKQDQYMQILLWLKELLQFREDEERKREVATSNYNSYFLLKERLERMKDVIKNMKPYMSGCSRCVHSRELTMPGMFLCNLTDSVHDEYNKYPCTKFEYILNDKIEELLDDEYWES